MWNVSHMPRHRAGALCVRLRRQRRRRPSHSSTLCSCTKATKRWRRSRRMQKEEDLFHFVTVFAMRVATKAQFVLCQPAAPIVNAAEPIYILFIARGVFAHCLPKASTYLHTLPDSRICWSFCMLWLCLRLLSLDRLIRLDWAAFGDPQRECEGGKPAAAVRSDIQIVIPQL